MKKILSFFVAGALALGLIGCSGDLHDMTYTEDCIGLYLAGDIQTDKENRAKLTFVDATTQKLVFKYDSSTMNYWGGGNGKINFKLVTDATSWTQDFGWKKDIAKTISINDDFIELYARDSANSNPGNIVVENLIDGKEYTVEVNYDAANLVAKVRIVGDAIDFPTLKVVTVDENGKDAESFSMTREGTTYSYTTIPAEDGSVKYYITNGYLYFGKDGKCSVEKPGAEDLAVFEYKKENDKKGDPVVYGIVVKTSFDTTSDVTISSGIYDTSFFATAGFVGSITGFDWNGSVLLTKYREDNSKWVYPFVATSNNAKFSIQMKPGVWNGSIAGDGMWCYGGRANDDAGDAKVIKPTDTAATEMVARDKDSSETNMLVSGLKICSEYELVITVNGTKVSAQVVLVKENPEQLQDITIKVSSKNGFQDNTVIILKECAIPGVTEVDGSLFSWSGGTKVTCGKELPVVIEANCNKYEDWVKNQCDKLIPMESAAAKLQVGGTEAFIVFKLGETTTITEFKK